MYKSLFMLLISLPLVADFFPKTTTTTIKAINKQIEVSKPLKKGMSCIIIHNYGNNIKAMTHICEVTSHNTIKVIQGNIIQHQNIPTINTSPKVGDSVKVGYLYSNLLLIAPDEKTYENITKKYHKKWLHPDLYAMFLSQENIDEITKESLEEFAKRYQVGLIMIVKKREIVLYDPISKNIVAKKPYKAIGNKSKYPFYMHFKELDTGWFSKKDGDYYQSVERFK